MGSAAESEAQVVNVWNHQVSHHACFQRYRAGLWLGTEGSGL